MANGGSSGRTPAWWAYLLVALAVLAVVWALIGYFS